MKKPGRNDPCPCGSGKKYKKCCLRKAQPVSLDLKRLEDLREALIDRLLEHSDRFYPRCLAEAWEDFSGDEEMPPIEELAQNPDFSVLFTPWFLYRWVPDNVGVDDPDLFYPEMPIARHYLTHHADTIDPAERRFIEAVLPEPYSFFQVTQVVPGHSLTLRDLMARRTVTVHDRTLSEALQRGAIVFGQIATLDGMSLVIGLGGYWLPPRLHGSILDVRDAIEEKWGRIDLPMLYRYDWELRVMYMDYRDELLNPQLPQLTNTDGHPLELTTLHYRLHCPPQEAFDALVGLAKEPPENLLAHAQRDAQGALQRVEFPWIRVEKDPAKPLDNTVLAHFTIDGDRLTVQVNSRQRAGTAKAQITRRLGERAEYLRAVIESVEKQLTERLGQPLPPPTPEQRALQESPEVQAAIRQLAEDHWRKWPDIPLPALGGQTPRQAAATPEGRERLEGLLLEFERNIQAKPDQPFNPDVDRLRKELGLHGEKD